MTGDFIPAQISGTHHPPEFTHLQALAVLFDNQDREVQNDKSRLLYARYVLAEFQAFLFCLVGKYFFPLSPLCFSAALSPITFVVSL